MLDGLTETKDTLNELIQFASLSLDEFERKLIKTMQLMQREGADKAKEEFLKGDWIYAGENSAYLFSNYGEVISFALDTHHLFGFSKTPSLMSDEELEKRISDIEKTLVISVGVRSERYGVAVKKLFEMYIRNEMSRESLNKQLDSLEDKFPIETTITEEFKTAVKKIFNGYFWGREEINRSIADKYQEYIRCCYLTFSLEEYLNSAEKCELEVVTRDMPRVESYSLDVGEIFVDPTIPSLEKLSEPTLTDDEKQLIIFKSLFYDCRGIHFSFDDEEQPEISMLKWNKLKGEFPKIAEEFVKRGIEYHQSLEREKDEKNRAIKEKYAQKRAAFTSEQFERIEQIFVGTDDVGMVYVVE